MTISLPYYAWLLQRKSTYIVKLFKLRVVKDEVHSGHLGKDGPIAERVSQCGQPWINLGEVCVHTKIHFLFHFLTDLRLVPTISRLSL